MLYQVSLFHPCVLNKLTIKLFQRERAILYQLFLFYACVLYKKAITLPPEKGGCYIRFCYFIHVCSIKKPLNYFQTKGDVVSGFIISYMCS